MMPPADQQYYPPPPPMMGDQQQQWGQPPMAGAPPPPPQYPPPPPPMDQTMMPPQAPPPPVDPAMMQPHAPPPPMDPAMMHMQQQPLPPPQQYYEQPPPPQVMPFPPPPPPPEEPKPENIPVPPPPKEEESKSDDMEIDTAETTESSPLVQGQEEETKIVYAAGPTTFSSQATVSAPPTVYSAAPAPTSKFMNPKFSTGPSDSQPPPPPPTVAFPTQLYSAHSLAQESAPAPPVVAQLTPIQSAPSQPFDENKTPAQKAAEELMQVFRQNRAAEQATEPEPPKPKGFVPVPPVEQPKVEVVSQPEPETEIKHNPQPEPEPEAEKPSYPTKTTAQQLLERIKQKQAKAAQASVTGAATNPVLKSTRRFFNPAALTGSKVQFAMPATKKSVTAESPLKDKDEDADKKKKKDGKKEMYRPGIDGEETLSSIMQKYQQHQKTVESLKKDNSDESEVTAVHPEANGAIPTAKSAESSEEKLKGLYDDVEPEKKKSKSDEIKEDMKEKENVKEIEEKKPAVSPERRRDDDRSSKSRRSPSAESESSKSRQYRSSKERQKSKSPERRDRDSRDRRDRRSRSRSYEKYSSKKTRRSPSPRRKDYDDRQRRARRSPSPRYSDSRREADYRRRDRSSSPYSRGSRNRRQERSPSPRSDYKSRQRDRSQSPRSRNYRGQQKERSESPRNRKAKDRSPCPDEYRGRGQEYSRSPEDRRPRKTPEETYFKQRQQEIPRESDFRSGNRHDLSPPLQEDFKSGRGRDYGLSDHRSVKQRQRTPSPKRDEYLSSKQRNHSPSPDPTDFRRQQYPTERRSSDFRTSRPREQDSSPDFRSKTREMSPSPRSAKYPSRPVEKSKAISPPPREVEPRRRSLERKQEKHLQEEKRSKSRRDSSSSSSSSSDSSSSDESDSERSSAGTPEDERIKKEKREKLLMELKSIEESLEKQRTMKKKTKGKEVGRSDDRERSEDRQSYKSEDRQSYKSSQSEEYRKRDQRQRKDDEARQMIPEYTERGYDDQVKQPIPDRYMKSVEKYQKEYKSRRNDYDEPLRGMREEIGQSYRTEEKWTRTKDPQIDSDYDGDNRGVPSKRVSDDDRRYSKESKSYFDDDLPREQIDLRVREDRRSDSRFERPDSSDDERTKIKPEPERKRETRAKYSDRSSVDEPEYEERYKSSRSDPRRGREGDRRRDYDDGEEPVVRPKKDYGDRRPEGYDRKPVEYEMKRPEDYDDRRTRDREYRERRPAEYESRRPEYGDRRAAEERRSGEYGERRQGDYGERRPVDPDERRPSEYDIDEKRREYGERRPGEYGDRRQSGDFVERGAEAFPDRGGEEHERKRSQYESKPRGKGDYQEIDRKREWPDLPVDYEESPKKKEKLDPSKTSEYESYEGYYQGSKASSEKSYVDPVDELDYYLNKNPKKNVTGQPEKNGKWQTDPRSQSPPDIRQSYYSPNHSGSEEDEVYEKKSKKKKKNRSRSPVSRESKKKSKKSKRSPSEESEEHGRYRRSYRSPEMEELDRRRSQSPRYRRQSSPEEQPYNTRAERYWRPPDHKLDEIHHYTDKKHKSASMEKDFPKVFEMEKGNHKVDDVDQDNDEKSENDKEKRKDDFYNSDPTKKKELADPPGSDHDNENRSQEDNAPIDDDIHEETAFDKNKETDYVYDKGESEDKPTRRRPKLQRLPVQSKSSASDAHSDSSSSDIEKSSVQTLEDKRKTSTETGSTKNDKTDDNKYSEIELTEQVGQGLKVTQKSTKYIDIPEPKTELDETPLIVSTRGPKLSIIADYESSEESDEEEGKTKPKIHSTDSETREFKSMPEEAKSMQDVNASQNLADQVFQNMMSQIEGKKSTATAENMQDSNIRGDSKQDEAKSDPTNDAIKLQYKRTRYGIHVKSKETDDKPETSISPERSTSGGQIEEKIDTNLPQEKKIISGIEDGQQAAINSSVSEAESLITDTDTMTSEGQTSEKDTDGIDQLEGKEKGMVKAGVAEFKQYVEKRTNPAVSLDSQSDLVSGHLSSQTSDDNAQLSTKEHGKKKSKKSKKKKKKHRSSSEYDERKTDEDEERFESGNQERADRESLEKKTGRDRISGDETHKGVKQMDDENYQDERETKKTESTDFVKESQSNVTSRRSLRSRGSDVKEVSPKPARIKQLRKSEDAPDSSVGEERQAARRRTRSSRSAEGFVDQKTPEVPIERQLSKRHKKSNREDVEKESDSKPGSLSVDLSSVALPGEGIKIKIFNEAVSPTSPKKKAQKLAVKSTMTCSVRLEDIVLPGELPSVVSSQPESSISDASQDDHKKQVVPSDTKGGNLALTSSTKDASMESQSAEPSRKEYPIRSQGKTTQAQQSMLPRTTFPFRSRKLPDDRRQPIKFGLPKTGNTGKIWTDDEDDFDFAEKLAGKKEETPEVEVASGEMELEQEPSNDDGLQRLKQSPKKMIDVVPTSNFKSSAENTVRGDSTDDKSNVSSTDNEPAEMLKTDRGKVKKDKRSGKSRWDTPEESNLLAAETSDKEPAAIENAELNIQQSSRNLTAVGGLNVSNEPVVKNDENRSINDKELPAIPPVITASELGFQGAGVICVDTGVKHEENSPVPQPVAGVESTDRVVTMSKGRKSRWETLIDHANVPLPTAVKDQEQSLSPVPVPEVVAIPKMDNMEISQVKEVSQNEPPEADLYDPLEPTADDLYDPMMPTDDEPVQVPSVAESDKPELVTKISSSLSIGSAPQMVPPPEIEVKIEPVSAVLGHSSGVKVPIGLAGEHERIQSQPIPAVGIPLPSKETVSAIHPGAGDKHKVLSGPAAEVLFLGQAAPSNIQSPVSADRKSTLSVSTVEIPLPGQSTLSNVKSPAPTEKKKVHLVPADEIPLPGLTSGLAVGPLLNIPLPGEKATTGSQNLNDPMEPTDLVEDTSVKKKSQTKPLEKIETVSKVDADSTHSSSVKHEPSLSDLGENIPRQSGIVLKPKTSIQVIQKGQPIKFGLRKPEKAGKLWADDDEDFAEKLVGKKKPELLEEADESNITSAVNIQELKNEPKNLEAEIVDSYKNQDKSLQRKDEESTESESMVSSSEDTINQPEPSGMIEVAPDENITEAEPRTSLLTSKQLQLPLSETKHPLEPLKPAIDGGFGKFSPLGRPKAEFNPSKPSPTVEEGEILSEVEERKDIGMAIQTVVSGKGKKTEQVSSSEVESAEEGQGQVIESIITARGKAMINYGSSKTKSENDEPEDKPTEPEHAEEKVKKKQTEEALKLLEQFKGIDTKNEEAIKMIEKFRSVDKELKTLDLDKPRSKKEGWERESYKDRYEESKYRESNKYKEKESDRYSRDKDYDDRYSRDRDRDDYRDRGSDKRRDRKRRDEDRYDNRDRDRYESRGRDRYDSRNRYDRKRFKKDRYHDSRDRSYSRSRSRSPDRRRSRDQSRSRSRDRSREKSFRRRSRERSRSRERGRKSKRSRKDRRRYSSDDSDNSRSSSRSRQDKDSFLDSSKGEVDKLTEEWIRMATEKPKKSKTQSASSSTSATGVQQTSSTPGYYQDAYGNYYPIQGYQGMPAADVGYGQQPAGPTPGLLPQQVGQAMPHQAGPGMPPHQTGQGMPPQQVVPGMPPQQVAPGIPQQSVPGHGVPPGMPQAQGIQATQSQMGGMPPQQVPSAGQMPQYQQPNQNLYGQGYGSQSQMYGVDQTVYGAQQQGQAQHGSAGLLPTPQARYSQDQAMHQGQYQIPPEYNQGAIQQSPLIGERPLVKPTDSSPKVGGLQGTRLPFPMPTQQNVPTFKPAVAKPEIPVQKLQPPVMALAQQKIPVTASPQEAGQSPSQSRATESPVVVTSSSQDLQLPELPYQGAIQPETFRIDEGRLLPEKPLSKPLMALKGFKIKQKGLSLVMPPENVVSSSLLSDTEEKPKKIPFLEDPAESGNTTPTPELELPKHPPPSSQTGLPIKLGMKQDKKDVDLQSPPPSASPRPEKVKSRWRRLSDFEAPATQSPDSNATDVTASSGSEGSPLKELTSADSKPVVYDAWDPSSDLIITPEVVKTPPKTTKKEVSTPQKRDKKDKTKESESPLKIEKPKEAEKVKEPEEEKDPSKPPQFEPVLENLYLSER